jgi:hypothetical protein
LLIGWLIPLKEDSLIFIYFIQVRAIQMGIGLLIPKMLKIINMEIDLVLMNLLKYGKKINLLKVIYIFLWIHVILVIGAINLVKKILIA